jgi:hypothetical protein
MYGVSLFCELDVGCYSIPSISWTLVKTGHKSGRQALITATSGSRVDKIPSKAISAVTFRSVFLFDISIVRIIVRTLILMLD